MVISYDIHAGVSAKRGNAILLGQKLFGGTKTDGLLPYVAGCVTEDVDFGDGSGDASCATYGAPGTGTAHVRTRYPYQGAFFDKTTYDGLASISFSLTTSRGLCSDDEYIAINGGIDGIEYSKVDGTGYNTFTGTNFTLVKGVLLTVDGTSEITQTVLDDEI